MQLKTKKKLMKLVENLGIQFKILQIWSMVESLNIYLKLSYFMPSMVCGYYLLPWFRGYSTFNLKICLIILFCMFGIRLLMHWTTRKWMNNAKIQIFLIRTKVIHPKWADYEQLLQHIFFMWAKNKFNFSMKTL